MYDLAILNGDVYFSGEFVNTNVYIKNGRIAFIGEELMRAAEVYDAYNKLVLPGFIDPHVHFSLNTEKGMSADTFFSGSISAAFGGITTFIDFLDPIRQDRELDPYFENRMNLASDSVIDYSFHSCLGNFRGDISKVLKKIKNYGIPSVKVFTTYSQSDRMCQDYVIDEIMSFSRKQKILLMVHAENDSLIRKDQDIEVKDLYESRNCLCETTEVIKLAQMNEYHDGNLYIVHTGCGEIIQILKEKYCKLLSKSIILESAPHYFMFDSNVYSMENGFLFTMTPPLKPKKQRSLLWENFDAISVIGTDHCPFRAAEKNQKYVSEIPMGVGGVEHSFEVMYNILGKKVIDKFTINPARIFGLFPQKGTIFPSSDADIVIFDPNKEHTIKENHSGSDYNIYKGITVKGAVESTICRGKFAVKNGIFMGKRGNGHFVKRNEHE
ncbi:MAG: amidohydrolase family protein [Petrotogaceae bacterium]|jgi:dihydropyrimidinase|nr:amidohydrolase family protein [Petrotogaceae bacterium]